MRQSEAIEDLVAWQRTRALAKAIYSMTQADAFRGDYGFVDQIRRAAVSAMNNVAEGYERMSSPADVARFLIMAKGSAGEVRSMLYLAWDIGYIDRGTFEEHRALADDAIRVIVGFRKWTTSVRKEGPS